MSSAGFDVAILGAGVAGCATALALHSAGISSVVVIEAGSATCADWIGESLPPDIATPLKTLGLWAAFRADAHEPCLGSCAAWGSPQLGYNDFLANVNGVGWHIHRPRFDALFRRAVAALGLPIRFNTRLSGAERLTLEGCFRLALHAPDGKSTILARHVVDATGTRGSFASRMGARSVRHDLLVFLTATAVLPPGAWPSRMTMTETVADGWWYAAALPGNRVSLAFATDPAISRTLRLDRTAEWLDALSMTRHIGPRLGRCPVELEAFAVRAVPVCQRENPCGARWIAVGDAAATFDPLGSEGIYKALDDGIHAAAVLAAAPCDHAERAAEYAAYVAANTQNHLALRRHFYALERQWPGSPFWERRQRPERAI